MTDLATLTDEDLDALIDALHEAARLAKEYELPLDSVEVLRIVSAEADRRARRQIL